MSKTTKKISLPRPLPRKTVEQIYARLAAVDPEPKTELNYTNPYTLLVAVVLSAQATDKGVNKATKALFEVADSPQKMIDLGEERVRDYVKTIGLFRTKAKNVILLSQRLIDCYGGEVPEDREALESLAGVGRKTANVVLNVVFGQPTMAVDTHIFRVGNRTRMAPGHTPLEVEKGLLKNLPDAYAQHAHHWLILQGRYTCLARKPRCWLCAIADLCAYKDKTPAPDKP
ncbi:MAG: endonuclease III [Robiginitomaculum sp.]|nr:MAG: endonuclease III [Robiginitomaculum sp.]